MSETVYTYEDIRAHRTTDSAWFAIHGIVYDVTKFIQTHPGGTIIMTGAGRDATALFETHHNMIEDHTKINQILGKYKVGIVKDHKKLVSYDTKFSQVLLKRAREAIKGKSHRSNFKIISAVAFFFVAFLAMIIMAFRSGHIIYAILIGILMSTGHTIGHSANHAGVSDINFINKTVSLLCTSLWGLKEKNWEFSHLISHHCYNYTDRDYVMEQHVPLKYFRIRAEDEWKPVHKYQHYYYIFTPFTSLILGSIRLQCAPWIFVAPFLEFVANNNKSPAPAPQFFASGSNTDYKNLTRDEDGVGPERFVIFDSSWDTIVSLILSNVIWLPLFLFLSFHYGILYATLFNSICFGLQASIATDSLLTQHLCEDIKLSHGYEENDDWYAKQIEASTTITLNPLTMWLSCAMSYQTEHHLFPSLSPALYLDIRPAVEKTCKEFGVHYNYFPSKSAAKSTVFKMFRNLSVPTKKVD